MPNNFDGEINDRSIVMILEDLTSEELSKLVTDCIRENHQHLERSQLLFDQIEACQSSCASEDDLRELRHSYRHALLKLKIHHELVRIVIDALGYVPNIPSESKAH
ncbi:transcriptional repressor TraM [Hoeflea sp.]|uniref:transcriptional repressor TraM n=1 Tax=Hoeflea sp. TaxID=1940281 RepID=UPI003262152E